MINKVIMTAGTIILSIMILVAATQVETEQTDQDKQQANDRTLYGEVIDADTEQGIPNATVYLKRDTEDDWLGLAEDDQEGVDQQEGMTRPQHEDNAIVDSTTTDHNGEFIFENVNAFLHQRGMDRDRQSGMEGDTEFETQEGQTQQGQQEAYEGQEQDYEDYSFVLEVRAEGYESEEKEVDLKDYVKGLDKERDSERVWGEEDQEDYDQEDDDIRVEKDDHEREKDKEKVRIELNPEN